MIEFPLNLSSGGILVCWGIQSKVLIGCAFFKDELCHQIIYDKPMIEKILSLKLFPAAVNYTELTRIRPMPDLTRAYFDGHLLSHSNGILQVSKTRTHAKIEDGLYPRFANALFGKLSEASKLEIFHK